MEKIKLGISACLAGEKTRYDGTDKLDAGLVEELGRFAVLVPVCPEVECGLPVPREEMQLVDAPDGPRLVCRYSGADHTGRMRRWAEARIRELAREGIDGFILKSSSPSCGLVSAELHGESPAVKKVAGLFARLLEAAFPELPLVEETALRDPEGSAEFMLRLRTGHGRQ